MLNKQYQSGGKAELGSGIATGISRFYLLRDPLGAQGYASPWLSFCKAFIDPFVVVLVLYGLSFYFDISRHGPFIELALVSFLISALALDGLSLLLPGSGKKMRGIDGMLINWLIAVVVILGFGMATGLLELFPEKFIYSWLVIVPIALLLVHCLLAIGLIGRIDTQQSFRKAVIVGANKSGQLLANKIRKNPQIKMEFLGFFDDRTPDRLPEDELPNLKGRLADLTSYIKDNGVQQVYISLPMTSQPRIMSLLEELQDCTASVYFLPDLLVFDLIQARIDHVNGLPVISICETPFVGSNGIVKRISDIVLSLLILSIIWPILLVIAALIKLTSPGPVLFKQNRYGEDGESILVYKFRSMTVMENGDAVVQARQGDKRLTPIGGFLRKSSLDELPQFINVLQGRMSIVGPRPHANAHNEMYRKIIRGYMVRHKVKPGITGWAQVNGYRGETDTVDKMESRVSYDLDYLRNWSLWLDLKIIFMTVVTVWRDKNAY
ncbi:undecaprenyl-phosphate glucose phosphotransferase [Aquitalea sp.]|uniref:undecaprenyl-phosphate glucose phosphotransferase n=1 Tax=Aquitalea sp. TaxID=1872623 RepID=UPI00258E0DC0|nr:undecaprenyl-phosphate glucose phosphotransferase [Aquitalea sp.]